MSDWNPVVVLPNLCLTDAIECGDHAAIVPSTDARAEALAKDDPNLGGFLTRFTDAFGKKITPSILLFRADAPKQYLSGEAISGLRDAMSISAVAVNRAHQLNRGAACYFVWSDFFSVYPWMVAKDRSGLIAYTPAMAAFHDVSEFGGQCSPQIFIQPMDRTDFDRPLRAELIAWWQRRYGKADSTHTEIALFRALNMAFSASSVPSGQEITYYDVGRQIALWVSAFEILAHPGEGGKANLKTVYELLKIAPWKNSASKAEAHACYNNRGDTLMSINGCWLYGLLYQARNNFLHGNPVAAKSLRLPSKRNLIEIAAPLFRMALAGFLRLTFPEEKGRPYSEIVGKLMQFYGPQDAIEEALLGAHEPPTE